MGRTFTAGACILALAGAVCVGSAGCDGEDEALVVASEQDSASTMNFDVDATLIGAVETFEDFGVQFSPPAGWQALPGEQVAAMAAAVNGAAPGDPATQPASELSSDNYRAEPLAVFGRGEEGLWLIVSAINVSDPADYTARLKQRPDPVMTDEFKVSGIQVHQYLVRPKAAVNFKLLLLAPGQSESRRLQLDYVVPLKDYQRLVRTLESSIGSLRQTR